MESGTMFVRPLTSNLYHILNKNSGLNASNLCQQSSRLQRLFKNLNPLSAPLFAALLSLDLSLSPTDLGVKLLAILIGSAIVGLLL